MFVPLLTFFSASPPRKPMRVILLRYIRFSCSARLSRAPEASGRGSQDQKLLFWGTGTGEPEPERCRRQSRSFAGAGRRKSPEAVPRRTGGTGNGTETVST